MELESAINFVTDYGDPQFPLSDLEGLRITLRNGWATVLEHTIPASELDFVSLADPRYIRSVRFMSTQPDEDYWEDTLDHFEDAARIFPQDEPWYGGQPFQPQGYLALTPAFYTEKNSVDLDWPHEFHRILSKTDDLVEATGNDRGIGLIDKALYEDGPSGKALYWAHTAAVFNLDKMASTIIHEVLHTDEWVQIGRSNHDFWNTSHSKYDEGEWHEAADKIASCDSNLTFRRALLDQLGHVPRVMLLGVRVPKRFALTGCGDPELMPRSVMAYAPKKDDGNSFLEPLDRQKALNESSFVALLFAQGLQVRAKCTGCPHPAELPAATLASIPVVDMRGRAALAVDTVDPRRRPRPSGWTGRRRRSSAHACSPCGATPYPPPPARGSRATPPPMASRTNTRARRPAACA